MDARSVPVRLQAVSDRSLRLLRLEEAASFICFIVVSIRGSLSTCDVQALGCVGEELEGEVPHVAKHHTRQLTAQHSCATASVSELACIYLALILHDNEVTVMEGKINALIKAASINVEPFWPGFFAKALANINIGSLICSVGSGGPAPATGAAPAGGPAPSTTAAPAEEKKVEAKKEESEESNDDMGFGLFD
ncbi:large ribosomal subunit protein P1-like [Dugong dugon]